MCSTATSDLIREVLTEKVNRDEAFTAFDISCDVKELAKQRNLPSERHRDMRGEIHNQVEQYVQQGVYDRVLRDVGAPSQAFVYYPTNGYDPSSYTPRQRSDGKPAPSVISYAPTAVAVAPAATAVADDDEDDGDGLVRGRTGDARGTVAVPSHIMRAAGFKFKDVAYVSATTQNGDPALVLAKQLVAGHSKLTCYTVDHGDNVRITEATLKTAGLDAGSYDFEREGDKVYVKNHK